MTFRRLRGALALGALAAAAALFLGPLAVGRWTFYSRGPVSTSHGGAASDCTACHGRVFDHLRRGRGDRAPAMGVACLRCHAGTIGSHPGTGTARHGALAPGDLPPCAACHVEHREVSQPEGPVLPSDRECIECHRRLSGGEGEREDGRLHRIGSFTAPPAGVEDGDLPAHPEFRPLSQRRPGGESLRFNHRLHLLVGPPSPGDGAGGDETVGASPPARPSALRCDDCHRAGGEGVPFRYGAGGASSPVASAGGARPIPRESYMAPIAYSRHCAGCHPLRVDQGADSPVAGEEILAGLVVPHRTPDEIRAWLPGQVAARRPGAAGATVERLVAEIERRLYQRDGEGCARCHRLAPAPPGSPAPPAVVAPGLPARFFPRAAFSHARHTVAYGAYDERACLACHAGALASTSSADLLLPGIDDCRNCHSPAGRRDRRAIGGAPSRCTTCHPYHEPPREEGLSGHDAEAGGDPTYHTTASVIEDGRRETRQGLRRGAALWPLSAFFDLPARVWGLPEATPGSERWRRELFDRYGIFPADGPNDGLPLGLLRSEGGFDGRDGLMITCELCHSTSLFGKIVVGAPNPFSNLGRLWADLDAAAGGSTAYLPFALTPGSNTVVTSADQLGLLGLVLREPDMSGSLLMAARLKVNAIRGLQAEFDAMAYVKTPPWFTYATRARGAAGYYADGGQPRHGNFAAFTYLTSFRATDGTDLSAALAAWKRGGPSFLSSLQPPRYPFPIQAERAARGRHLYDAHCARCHGAYAAGAATPEALRFPGRVIPVAEVKTDPHRARFPTTFVQRMKVVLKEDYTITGGYVPPPLTAIWCRSPYLHNGSVPTLMQLLDPARRTAGYVLMANPDRAEDFDQVEVGWKTAPLSDEVADGARLFDPAVTPGLSNSGHTYGSGLSDAERADLVEFLKTL